MATKAGLYRRISTGEQSKFSLEAQEEQLRNYCKARGFEVFKVYQDIKGRFTFEERAGLMQLLDDVEHRKFNVLLVTELDRLAGDEGILGYIKLSLKKAEVKLIAVSEEGKVKNEYEDLIESILTAVAKFENMRKRLRCRRGIAQAKQEGKTLNRAPFGYRIIDKGKKESKLVIDEDKGKVVIEIFERAGKGESVYSIAKTLKISKSNIRYLLRNKFYCDGNFNGKHQPLISEETFSKANLQYIY
jgi:site-specific DNA recombinase